jgi:predicted dehydrogenase
MQKAAIVGLGWWGQHILRQMHNSKVVRITGAVGNREEHRVHASHYGISFTTNFESILKDPSVDFVILTTPHALHSQQIVAVARADKHVFCEKPVGLSVKEVRQSLDVCGAAGVRLGVGHERRFEPAMEELRKLLKNGSFGTIMHVEATFSHDKLCSLSAENWRVSTQGVIPLAMTATGIHLTDLFIDLIGPIEQVTAFPAVRVADSGYADTLSVHVRFVCGATGHINTVLATPFYSRFVIYGTDSWAEVRDGTHPDEAGASTLTLQGRTGPPTVSTLSWKDSVRANLEQFALSIQGQATYPFTEDQIVGNVAVLAAVSQSVTFGGAVSVADMLRG